MACVHRFGHAPDLPLNEGWSLSVTDAGACAGPADAAVLTDWIAGRAPGTTGQALEAAGRWSREAPAPLHDKDVWWRRTLEMSGPHRLRFEGLATIAQVWLDERPWLDSRSMFAPQEVDVELAGGETLWICFRALAPHLDAKGPRARWRPRMIDNQGLRLVRTTLLGHMPGWCPAIDVVGPWRPVTAQPRRAVEIDKADIRASFDERGPYLRVEVAGHGLESPRVRCGGAEAAMERAGDGVFRAELRVPNAEPWWPHTHGGQPLYEVQVIAGEAQFALGRTGFRALEVDRGADGKGFGLKINGEPVFCRGACWITPDLVGVGGTRGDYEPTLRRARDAGLNMVRISGVGLYESPAFFEVCDELGLLVWQDFMFANFDYPAGDPAFVEQVRDEARALLSAVQASPSLAVLCGGSEVMQQATMMGLAPADLPWPLFEDVLAGVAGELRPDVAYVANTPCGGALPFVADQGVTHYYGVGAYERPLEDARRADVRFAAECLAFANVPQADSLGGRLTAPAVHDPRWKARVPRDRGASWDFEDVRDHYLGRLFGEEPARLRREDPNLYLDLSRAVSGEAMAAVFSEWRRAKSPCTGGLVWTLRDLQVGAGWGLIDALGEAKPALHALAGVLQPVQVLLTDEGVNGLAVHVLNEGAQPLDCELRLAAFGCEGPAVVDVQRDIVVDGRGALEIPAFELMGRFFDLSYAYRFGPRAHDAVCAQLIRDGQVLSQVFHFLPGVAGWRNGGSVEAVVEEEDDDGASLVLTAERLQRFVHIAAPAWRPSEDWLALAPGEPRRVRLSRRDSALDEFRPRGEILAPGGAVVGAFGA